MAGPGGEGIEEVIICKPSKSVRRHPQNKGRPLWMSMHAPGPSPAQPISSGAYSSGLPNAAVIPREIAGA